MAESLEGTHSGHLATACMGKMVIGSLKVEYALISHFKNTNPA